MTETISFIRNQLQSIYSPDEARNISGIILCHVTGLPPHQILLCKDKELSMTQKKQVQEIVERLMQSEPIQYILGECEFYGLPFIVNSSTLIPRPETEELVEYIIQQEGKKNLRILDIGTGSGCIAISLAYHMPQAQVEAIDISAEALEVAKENAARNNVTVRFFEKDILQEGDDSDFPLQKFDIIASNPPYVTEHEKDHMEKNVLEYEPHTALFVKDQDPLLFYRKIARLGKVLLKPEGRLYFEINRAYGEKTVELLQEEGYQQIILKKDLFGNDRVIKAKR